MSEIEQPTPTCPWPTEGEAWHWHCNSKGANMTPYRERMQKGHYGKPIATTTSQDLGEPQKAKPAAKKTKRS